MIRKSLSIVLASAAVLAGVPAIAQTWAPAHSAGTQIGHAAKISLVPTTNVKLCCATAGDAGLICWRC